MASNGIMQEIRTLLSQGKSSSEVIALDYKPSTVYKVQRQLRPQHADETAPVRVMNQAQPIESASQEESSSEPDGFLDWLFGPADHSAQSEDHHSELDQAKERIAQLEAEAGQVQYLQERLNELEAEAETATELRQQVADLAQELHQAGHTLEALRQSNLEWQKAFNEERSTREKAELKYENAIVIVP